MIHISHGCFNYNEGEAMNNSIEILGVYEDSFRINIYSINYFRMIGLIDIDIKYDYGIERVTLAFYRSSGTNSGKINGLWYPIVGIKIESGRFKEFTELINYVLTKTTNVDKVKKGWLAKSPFFYNQQKENKRIKGFSSGKHYKGLLRIGEILRDLYEEWEFDDMESLTPKFLNDTITSLEIYPNNTHSQRDNFERFIWDICNGG